MYQYQDRKARGVGLQNFKYSPSWDELCQILRMHSTAGYEALREHLPARTTRSIQQKNSREPQFPTEINDQVFIRVAEHLYSLDYSGPVCLACDDTKLHSTFRLYWNNEESSYFLLGGVDGPIRVLDPEDLQNTLEKNEGKQATKLRLWTITISRPRTTPLVVAALPIPNSLDAQDLARHSLLVIRGLIRHKVKIVSYACDGAKVERNVQQIIVETATSHLPCTVIKNPIDGRDGLGDIAVQIPIIEGQPVVMVQDSKHALKTFRNNLFSGARLLTIGDSVAGYCHILDLSRERNSPLYKRDVERLDQKKS
ncbi:hypothetical protein AN958_02141 [Leucoagaricus sp. SymC.cos]|nr:hypothetical protein AN958_02141 [Leucoagaricus sp. SymC.cos]